MLKSRLVRAGAGAGGVTGGCWGGVATTGRPEVRGGLQQWRAGGQRAHWSSWVGVGVDTWVQREVGGSVPEPGG